MSTTTAAKQAPTPRVAYREKWAAMPHDERLTVLGSADAVASVEEFAGRIADASTEERKAAAAEVYARLGPLGDEIRGTKDYLDSLYRQRTDLFVRLSLTDEEQAAIGRSAGVTSMIVGFAVGASKKQR